MPPVAGSDAAATQQHAAGTSSSSDPHGNKMRFQEHLRAGILLEDEPQEFPVVLEKESAQTPLQLDVDSAGGFTLQVLSVGGGPAAVWNKAYGMAMHRDIRRFDRIFEVNGVRGDAKDLMQVMSDASRLEMMVRRPREYKLRLVRPDVHEPLGVVFDGRLKDVLAVQCFTHGSIFEDWNKANWEKPVRLGDVLVEVNGVRGDLPEMLRRLREEKDVVLAFTH